MTRHSPPSITTDSHSNTLAAILTAPTAAAIATIAIVGPQACQFAAQHLTSARGQPLRLRPPQAHYALWHNQHVEMAPEQLVVVPRHEQAVELHCHGGVAITKCILESLARSGCTIVPAEQLMVAQHRILEPTAASRWSPAVDDPCSAMAIRDAAEKALTQAATLKVAAILLDQLNGALLSDVLSIKSAWLSGQQQRAVELQEELLSRGRFGLKLVSPWRLTLAGPPNVGKSSLLNALCGLRRALVHNQPGTTRDALDTPTVIEGWPMTVTDTAGVRPTDEEIEREGIRRARARWLEADLGLLVVDATVDRCDAQLELLQERPSDVLIVLNKCDRLGPDQVEHTLARWRASLPFPAAIVPTSAIIPDGLQALMLCIGDWLDQQRPDSGTGVPFTAEQCKAIASWRT